MSNEYYSRSSPLRDFELIQNAFDLLPALSGNGDEVVVVNSAGTALTSVTEAVFNASIHTELGAIQDALAGYITGCIPSNNGSDATNDIDFTAGFVFDGTRGYTVGAKTKRADATWAAGSSAGGMASGLTFSATTNYHHFVLLNPSTGATDYGFDTSLTGANLLADSAVIEAGFTVVKRCSSLRTGGSAAWPLITAREIGIGLVGYLLKTPIFEFQKDWTGADDTAQTGTLSSIPGGIQVNSIFAGFFVDTSIAAAGAILFTSLDQTDTAPSALAASFLAHMVLRGLIDSQSGLFKVRTSTSRTFRYRTTGSTADHLFSCCSHGWEDSRL